MVLGEAGLRRVAVAGTLLAWAAGPGALARRFALVAPLAVSLVLWPPLASAWITTNLTGGSFWRTFWALPLPALLTLVLVAPLGKGAAPRRRLAGRTAWLLALAAFAAWVPAKAGPSRANGVTLGWPALKVPPAAHAAALALAESVPPGAHVVAPPEVAPWLATLPDRPYPLVVRDLYLLPFRAQLGHPEIRERVFMTRAAGGRLAGAGAPARFRAGLARFAVQAVCLRAAPAALREVLRAAGFERRRESGSYEIWVRT
jgi:hypothetical protein